MPLSAKRSAHTVQAAGDSGLLLERVASPRGGSGRVPTERQLLGVVRSLYADRAAPQGWLLQWRLLRTTGRKVGAAELRAAVLASPGLRALVGDPAASAGAGGKGLGFVALLAAEPPGFEGFLDEPGSEEASPQDLLIEAAQHLVIGGWRYSDDPRHDKYEVTEWLQECSATLAALPWGQVLKMVRWFIGGTAQVLGKREGRLVPYPASEEFDKQENARLCRPTGVRPGELYVSSWGQLVDLLEQLLDDGDGWVRISHLKKAFRSEFGMELSETAFGHTSLYSLLTDSRCAQAVAIQKATSGDAIWLRHAAAPQPQARAASPAARPAARARAELSAPTPEKLARPPGRGGDDGRRGPAAPPGDLDAGAPVHEDEAACILTCGKDFPGRPRQVRLISLFAHL